jgi:hypothetical protein
MTKSTLSRLALCALLFLATPRQAANAQVPPPAAAPAVVTPAAAATAVNVPPGAAAHAHPGAAPAAVPPAAPAASPLAPLPASAAQALAAIVEDPAPPALVRDQHYIISNELRQDVFRPSISDRGGVFIGVGSDQNYLMAGWARPELLVLFDFDQLVVNVHRAYRAFFLNASTPEEFMALWNEKNLARADAIIAAEYPEPTQRAAVLRAYHISRYAVPRRFHNVLQAYKAHQVPCFLSDQRQYDYIAALFRRGRVVMVRGDLTVGNSMSSIANAVRAMGSTVRVLYLSNAERYFNYTEPFRQSMLALPTDDHSLVLRTRARRDGSYEYIEQAASNFNAWVARRSIHVSFQYTHLREPVKPTPARPATATPDAQLEPELYAIRRLPEAPAPADAGKPRPPVGEAGGKAMPHLSPTALGEGRHVVLPPLRGT